MTAFLLDCVHKKDENVHKKKTAVRKTKGLDMAMVKQALLLHSQGLNGALIHDMLIIEGYAPPSKSNMLRTIKAWLKL